MVGPCCAKLTGAKKIAAIIGLTAAVGSGLFAGAYRLGLVACPCSGQYYGHAATQTPAQPQNP
ncbi:MAG: hypothetical protein HYZ53_23465 [Planctomycetes bacterium]|nr:hypothetical protein [Planctomycetota bacterium]